MPSITLKLILGEDKRRTLLLVFGDSCIAGSHCTISGPQPVAVERYLILQTSELG